jgi:hypothetical protein
MDDILCGEVANSNAGGFKKVLTANTGLKIIGYKGVKYRYS